MGAEKRLEREGTGLAEGTAHREGWKWEMERAGTFTSRQRFLDGLRVLHGPEAAGGCR